MHNTEWIIPNLSEGESLISHVERSERQLNRIADLRKGGRRQLRAPRNRFIQFIMDPHPTRNGLFEIQCIEMTGEPWTPALALAHIFNAKHG